MSEDAKELLQYFDIVAFEEGHTSPVNDNTHICRLVKDDYRVSFSYSPDNEEHFIHMLNTCMKGYLRYEANSEND